MSEVNDILVADKQGSVENSREYINTLRVVVSVVYDLMHYVESTMINKHKLNQNSTTETNKTANTANRNASNITENTINTTSITTDAFYAQHDAYIQNLTTTFMTNQTTLSTKTAAKFNLHTILQTNINYTLIPHINTHLSDTHTSKINSISRILVQQKSSFVAEGVEHSSNLVVVEKQYDMRTFENDDNSDHKAANTQPTDQNNADSCANSRNNRDTTLSGENCDINSENIQKNDDKITNVMLTKSHRLVYT